MNNVNQALQRRSDLTKFYLAAGLIISSFTMLITILGLLKRHIILPKYKNPQKDSSINIYY